MDECKRHFLLRASLAVEGRSFTLYEEMHSVKTKEKPQTHLNFMATRKEILAEDCQPIMVSDAGFRVPWFKLVASFGGDWIGRVRNRTLVPLANEETGFPGKARYDNATTTPKALGAAHMAQANPITCQRLLYKGKPQGRVHKNRRGRRSKATRSRKAAAAGKEPGLVATSLSPGSKLARKVVTLYTLRMQIEESFRDLKRTRFSLSLELHRSYQVERVQVRLLIAALAWMVAWRMGKATELTEQHWQYQANTVRTRKVLSSIFIGLKMRDDKRTTLTAYDLIAAGQILHDIIQSHCVFESIDAATNNLKKAA